MRRWSVVQETTALESQLSSLIVLSQQAAEEVTSVTRYDDEHIHAFLKDLIFVGHINTDLDSAEGAKGVAALFWRSPCDSRANLEWRNPLRTHGVRPLLFDQIVVPNLEKVQTQSVLWSTLR